MSERYADDWFDQNSPEVTGRTAAPTGGVSRDSIASAYQRLLGRAPDEGGLQGYLSGGHDQPWIDAAIQSSPEGTAYAKAQSEKAAASPSDILTRLKAAAKAGDPNAEQLFNDYFKARGKPPEDWSYWGPKLAQDPEYFGGRLETGDSFGGGGQHEASTPDYLAPFTEQFAAPEFQAPTAESVTGSQAFKTRLKAGQDALERSAAAKGTLLTGTTLKANQDYAQALGSEEYGNEYTRSANTWQMNYAKSLGEYNNRKATFYQNQDSPFAKLLAQETLDSNNANAYNQLGLGYATLGANTITGGGARGTEYGTQGANARAAGQVGAGNAWTNAFGNIGNDAMTAYYMSQYGKRNG